MKKKNVLFALALSCLLIGCSGSGDNSSSKTNISNDASTSSTNSIISYSEIDFNSEEAIQKSCSISGALLDIDIGRWLCQGLTYSCTVSTDLTDQNITFSSSNTDVLEVTLVENSINQLTLNAVQVGDSILRVFNAEGVLVYRNIVRVRPKKTVDEMFDYLVEVDHFQAYGFNGDASITFTEVVENGDSKQINGIYAGYDGSTYLGSITFEAEYAGTSSTGDSDEYCFNVLTWENTASDMILKTFNIDFTGCLLHPMTPNTVIDIFFPVTEA